VYKNNVDAKTAVYWNEALCHVLHTLYILLLVSEKRMIIFLQKLTFGFFLN
jgi:hypothetical protein